LGVDARANRADVKKEARAEMNIYLLTYSMEQSFLRS